MGKITTGSRAGRAVATMLFAAGCTMGADPDPNQLDLCLAAPAAHDARPEGPVLVVAEVAAPAPGATPTVETTGYEPVHERKRLSIALGQSAAHAIDVTVGKAFAATIPECDGTFVPCTDRDAVELMLVGRATFGVIGGALSNREQNAGLRQTPIGLELFALVVAPDFPLRSLTRAQVRRIFSGEVQDWHELGHERGPIVAVVPEDHGLAERAARILLPGDAFPASAVRVASEQHVAENLLVHRGAIGIVRVTGKPLPPDMKTLQIDWCPPTAEAFGYGTYPYGLPVHLVTAGQPNGEAQRFLEFARSEPGRELLGRRLIVP